MINHINTNIFIISIFEYAFLSVIDCLIYPLTYSTSSNLQRIITGWVHGLSRNVYLCLLALRYLISYRERLAQLPKVDTLDMAGISKARVIMSNIVKVYNKQFIIELKVEIGGGWFHKLQTLYCPCNISINRDAST